jgi:hypothetical protein
MNISKLQYPNKETALADLIAKGVYIETDDELIYGEGVHSVVEIGLIVEIEGTYDNEGNIIKEPIYYDGYFSDLSYEQDQHNVTRAALKIAQAQLEAIKAQANRPKKLVWQVKQCFNIKSLDFAELLNDGWEIMWQAGAFEPEGGYVVNANFKRLVELPADPAPDPDAAVAAAEAHLETIPLPPLDADPLDQPEPEVVYHISGEQKPAIKLGKYGEHIRKHGAADAIDILNSQIGANVSAAMAQALEDPVIQRMLHLQPLLSAQSTPVQ